jgi:hypothetical protein
MGHDGLIGNVYNSEMILRCKGEMVIDKLTFSATILGDPEKSQRSSDTGPLKSETN